MEEVKHDTPLKWLAALKSAQDAGHYLVVYDDAGRRIFGFIDHTQSKYHHISITNLMRGFQQVPSDLQEMFKEPTTRRILIEGE